VTFSAAGLPRPDCRRLRRRHKRHAVRRDGRGLAVQREVTATDGTVTDSRTYSLTLNAASSGGGSGGTDTARTGVYAQRNRRRRHGDDDR
jgi:hypothetical protein